MLSPRRRLNRMWEIASRDTNRRWFSALAATFLVNYLQTRSFQLSELLTSILTAFPGVVTHTRVSIAHTLSSCDLPGEELVWVMSSACNSLFHYHCVPPGKPLTLIAWLAPLNVTVSLWRYWGFLNTSPPFFHDVWIIGFISHILLLKNTLSRWNIWPARRW